MTIRAYRYASSPLSLHQARAVASPPGHRDRMDLTPPYDELVARFVPCTIRIPMSPRRIRLRSVETFWLVSRLSTGCRHDIAVLVVRVHRYPEKPNHPPINSIQTPRHGSHAVCSGSCGGRGSLCGIRGCHAPPRDLEVSPSQLVPVSSPCGDPSPRPGVIELPQVTPPSERVGWLGQPGPDRSRLDESPIIHAKAHLRGPAGAGRPGRAVRANPDAASQGSPPKRIGCR